MRRTRVVKGKSLSRGELSKVRKRRGSSNAGKYKNVKPSDFAGSQGGASEFSFPINNKKRARAALSRAHFAPNPAGIKRAVYKKYPSLNPNKNK